MLIYDGFASLRASGYLKLSTHLCTNYDKFYYVITAYCESFYDSVNQGNVVKHDSPMCLKITFLSCTTSSGAICTATAYKCTIYTNYICCLSKEKINGDRLRSMHIPRVYLKSNYNIFLQYFTDVVLNEQYVVINFD